MARDPFQTETHNYLLRSKYSNSLIMIAVAITNGRIDEYLNVTKSDGSWAGNATSMICECLIREGLAELAHVPGAWRGILPRLTAEGHLCLSGALAKPYPGGERDETWYLARIDGINTDGLPGDEPKWCTAHGWYPGHAPCAECVKLEELDAEDCATPMLNDFESGEFAGYPFDMPGDPGHVAPAVDDPLTEYEHILDARRALAPGNSTGLAQSHADEARFWRRLAESADDALLRAAYGLAAAAADVAATDLR
jgi:hypothetical protein